MSEQVCAVSLEDRLVAEFGEFMQLRELMVLLKYNNLLALRRAMSKDGVVKVARIGTKSLVSTRQVAQLLVHRGLPAYPGRGL